MGSHPIPKSYKVTCPNKIQMFDYDDVQASMKASQEKNWLQQHIQISPHPSVTFVLNIFQKILQIFFLQNLEKKGLLPHIKIFSQSHTPIPPENISQSWKGGWSNWLDDKHTWHCWEKVKTFIERGNKRPKNMTIATICHSFTFQIGLICIIWEKFGACVNLW